MANWDVIAMIILALTCRT